jgi:4-hydroxy-tetrahydrodipicolinate reductase
MIRVGVFGAAGRMGATVCRAVLDDPELELVAAVDPMHSGLDLRQCGIDASLQMGRNAGALADAGAEVAVDFTVVDAARDNIKWCADNGVHAVVGTTGFTPADMDDFRTRFEASSANAVIAPNFAIGAVLMVRFAELAAPWFETAEVIELHHDQKIDAPSGTALHTVERMAAASPDWAPDPTTKTVVEGARGGVAAAGIHVHSVRLRGLVAHEEVLLGTAGQSLSIRHDSYDRTSFMPGVVLAVKAVRDRPGLTVGLDPLLDL